MVPDADPSEPCLEPQTIRFLDELQSKADRGLVNELAEVGGCVRAAFGLIPTNSRSDWMDLTVGASGRLECRD